MAKGSNNGSSGRWNPFGSLRAAGSPLVEAQRPRSSGRSTLPVSPAHPDAIRARSDKWQTRILEYAEAIPEVAGAAAVVRCSIESVKFTVTGGNAAVRDRVQARIDQLDIPRIAELIWLSGESYVVWPNDPGVDYPIEQVDKPYSLSVAELKPARESGDSDQVKGPTDAWEDLPAGHAKMRIWRPSRGNRWKGSSPNKAAMDLLDAMYLHQLGDTALAKSRLAGAGLMFWPTNAPDVPVAAGEEPEPGSRQAMAAAFEQLSWESIDKQNERAATIPGVVFFDPGKDGVNYKPEMFRIDREDQADQYASRVQTHRMRYATAVELPVESLTGVGDTNHWSAWQIDVDKWKTWFAPLCELIRVQLEERVVKMYGDNLKLKVDPSELIAKPDAKPEIMQLAQLEMATPDSIQSALISGKIDDLVMKDPPPRSYNSSTVSNPPSDFKVGGDRGGGKYRDMAPAG